MAKFDLAKLFALNKLGKITLDEKLGILEHYGITFPRREIARSLLDIVGARVREAKRTNYAEAIAQATEQDMIAAAKKVVDKYMLEAEARFAVAQTEKATLEKLTAKLGERDGARAARRMKYKWQSVTTDEIRCPDCRDRHGREETMAVWRSLGVPRSGATVCTQWCRCELPAVGVPGSE